ncbi:MAG: dihydropteroate synthase [Pseudomonadota bacterium]
MQVMGILNVTPDSFSDGGKFFDPGKAVERAFQMKEEGADWIDIGAESTRPGSDGVDEATERERLWPILTRLARERFPVPISLDTSKPAIVHAAAAEGLIRMVNDVRGLRDPEMVKVVRETKLPVVLMHMFGEPRTMQQDFHYDDVVKDLIRFFEQRLVEIGLKENVILDPGIGFGKSVEQNLEILRRLSEFRTLGCQILVGASRKSFIGKVLDLEVGERLEGGLAAAAIATWNGASMLRVHDVGPTVRVVRMVEAIQGR